MAHFAILCPDEAGHLIPIGSVGRELMRRGHRVTVVARARSAPLAQQLGLPLHELPTGDRAGRLTWLAWLAFSLFGAGWMVWLRRHFAVSTDVLLRELPGVFRDLKVDAALVDESRPGGGTVAECLGLPYVTVSTTLTWRAEADVPPLFTGWDAAAGRLARARNRLGYAAWDWYTRPMLRSINCFRTVRGLPRLKRIGDTHSPLAHLAQACPEFDFPRRELPDTFHYVGSLTAQREIRGSSSFPWERLDGRPVVFASLGTVNDPANLPVFPKIARACAGIEAQLVMSLGRWHDQHMAAREKLGSLPGDPLLVDFAPQLELLDRAALLITHAGMNTTLESICRGVPMVAMPRSGDQPAVATRIERAGVGLRAPFRGGSAEGLRRIITRVLTEERFRSRVKELGQAMRAAGGVSRAADLVEEVLATRRPVRCVPSLVPPHSVPAGLADGMESLPAEGR